MLWPPFASRRSQRGDHHTSEFRVAGDRWAVAVSALLLVGLLLAGHFLNSAFTARIT